MKNNWINSYIKEDEFKDIEEAVVTAEGKTSAEIVPIVVKQSISTSRNHLLLTFIIATTCLIIHQNFPQSTPETLENWSTLIILTLSALLALILNQFNFVKRLLSTKDELIMKTEERAKLEFYEANISNTENQTGILIFISLLERKAIVLADKSISDKLPPETWNKVVELIISGVKKKSLANGLCEAIKYCGDLVSPLFPIQDDDQNELRNHLIIKP